MRTVVAFLGLGSNLAHPHRQLARAVAALGRLPASRVVRVSPNYLAAPIGCSEPQPDYVNAVLALATALSPRVLLAQLLAIERRQLRRRDAGGARNVARTLDLDLLLYGRRRMALPHLTVPHPRMHARAFVLRPLTDIAPFATIPQRGLACRLLRAASGQRIARTRSHVLR